MRKKSFSNSPRLLEIKKKKERVLKIKILLGFFSFAILFTVFILISRISALNIKEINISGNKVIDSEDLKLIVNENLEDYYLWFIPKTNVLFYPKEKIISSLKSEFPRIKDLAIKTENKTMHISLTERTGVYTWCGKVLPDLGISPEETECQFMDEIGYVFDDAPYFSNDVYLKFFGEITESRYAPEIFHDLIVFINQTKEMDFSPSSIFLKGNGEGEIYLSSNTLPPNTPKIIFPTDTHLLGLAENLQSALVAEPLATDIKEKYSSLQYIDLRFDNRVYYKFK